MKATIVDLRYRMKEVLRAIDRGETVTVLYRGKDAAAARAIDGAADRALSIVSLMELLQGARSKLEGGQLQRSLTQLRFSILPLSESIGSTAAPFLDNTPWLTAFR